MADVITRLKVESNEYDAKLKRAAQQLLGMEQACRKVQGTLAVAEKEELAFARSLGEMATKATSVRGQLRELTQGAADLTAVYRRMTDEERSSDFGRALSGSIDRIVERAAEARDALSDVTASISHAASDTRAFDQVSQGVSMMTSVMQTGMGAAKLLGVELGDNVEVLARLQSAMAVTNGLTQVQTALQRQSALMQGVAAVQAKALAAAQALYGKETKLATAAQAAFNAMAKANPYVLLASALVAVGGALVAFAGRAKEARAATEEESAALRKAREATEAYARTLGDSFAGLMTKYDGLKRQWQSLGSEHEKRQWIEENRRALEELGASVDSVRSAEDFFNGNTDAVVAAFTRRARAAAYATQLTELYRQQMELLDKKSRTQEAIKADAARNGRQAKAGDEIPEQGGWRNERYGSVDREGRWRFSEEGAALYSGRDASTSDAVVKIDAELDVNRSEIEKINRRISEETDFTFTPKASAAPAASTAAPAASGGAERELTGLIEIQERKVAELREAMRQAGTETGIAGFRSELAEAEAELDRLYGRLKDDGTEVKVEVGLSGLSTDALSEWTAGLREQMDGAEIGSALYESLRAQLADATALSGILSAYLESGLSTATFDAEGLWERILGPDGVPDDAWQAVVDDLNRKLEALKLPAVRLNFDTGSLSQATKAATSADSAWQGVARSVQSVGSAMQGLEDPGAKVAGIIASAIANIALSFAQSLKGTVTPWDWIAGAVGGAATMISTIAAIKSATAGSYEQGGIVPGNSWTGDRLTADVNSGELILNRAQQASIAAQLEAADRPQAAAAETVVSGEQLRIVLRNGARRRGMSIGEYLRL